MSVHHNMAAGVARNSEAQVVYCTYVRFSNLSFHFRTRMFISFWDKYGMIMKKTPMLVMATMGVVGTSAGGNDIAQQNISAQLVNSVTHQKGNEN